MSALRKNSKDEACHTHSPLKKSDNYFLNAPPISQVPYLNGVFDDEETINQPHVIYVRETDSEYIRRCKLGGSRDLLMYTDPATCKSKEPVPYPRALWWDAMCEDFPLSENADEDKQEEKKSAKREHSVVGTPAKVVHGEHSRSPDRQQRTTSTQSRLSTKSKRK